MVFENVKDDRVKKLAETLRSNGLAASETEAIRMAEGMTSTEAKIQKSYDEQHAEPDKSTATEEVVSRVVPEEPKPVEEESQDVPGSFDKGEIFKKQEGLINDSFSRDLNSDKSVKELVDEDANRVYSESAEKEVDEDISISEPEEVQTPVEEVQPEPEQVTTTEPSQEKPSDDGFEVDKTVEIQSEQKSEEERKKEIESMAESKVDLGDVFDTSKI